MCSIDGCPDPVIARGWCDRHYRRWRRHGDPMAGVVRGLSAEERFWTKVDKTEACWIWTAYRLPDGYGYFWDGYRRPGVAFMHRAHRWAYQQFIGPIPNGVEVCHRCDNPPCVRPDHLFLGTHSDNMQDSAKKGRQGRNRRSMNGRAKLTDQDVTDIRSRITGRYGERSSLAREYGVATSTISKILKDQTWS